MFVILTVLTPDENTAVAAAPLPPPPEMVTEDLAFGDIPQWDSLGHMEVMLKLEEAFGIEIDVKDDASLRRTDAVIRSSRTREDLSPLIEA